MDRLNQLRGDAGASRDSTLDTSSLLGDAYMTANDGSKYFSLSELDSSSTAPPLKEAGDEVTGDSPISTAESIISNLSPISKKSELDSFKIGEQIEAANILSGGVNIFDDNENSYDGDELIIDDAVAEGDDKSGEIKLGENTEVTFEKTDSLPDNNMEDTETAIPSKDTEVVLQIDGKNVDAIDIGNGLYLYRKDGEEELAAVQILDDNQQQPDIKFLKVRENAEGNLEVYEEIEIEVPKEVPTKEGNTIKNSSNIPVKDLNKASEPTTNRVFESKSQSMSNDTIISEVELDLNKDNINPECKTEVNLNGKMMKFSESRKSPLIGTYTPMTYHSTPNKEGIPLTKTMVDLQLHPNRHSENVKKTIEVHTDNCKQRLLETPSKSSKESNEHSRGLELLSPSLGKDLTNYMIVDEGDQTRQENNKDINKAVLENKTDETVNMKVNKEKNINENKLENQQSKLFNKEFESIVKNDKTVISDIKTPDTPIEASSVAPSASCKLNIKSFNEKDVVNVVPATTTINQKCSNINKDIAIIKTVEENKDEIKTEIPKEIQKECKGSDNFGVNSNITTANDNNTREEQMESFSNCKDIIQCKESDTDTVVRENQNINDSVSNSIIRDTDLAKDLSKETKNNSSECNDYVKLPQNDFVKKVFLSFSDEEKLKNSKIEMSETAPKFNPNHRLKEINTPLETLGTTTKIESDGQLIQTLKGSSNDEHIKIKSHSQVSSALKEMDVLIPIKAVDIKADSLLSEKEPSLNILHNLPKEELKNIPELKQQENKSKINASIDNEMKRKSDLKSSHEKRLFSSTSYQSSKNLKIKDITEGNKMDSDKKKISDKLSKDFDKKMNSELNRIEMISSIVTDASKPVTNTECQSVHKASHTAQDNCSHQSSLVKTTITAEKVDTQKKNELNQKSPILYKNTKISLLTPDLKLPHVSKNLTNESEQSKSDIKKESVRFTKVTIPKSSNNNKAAVPFGMWTEANRQEFLNKIKESKVPINTSNTKQLKQPNDLNRRDILQKIDSQRQSNIASIKVQELNTLNKIKLKHETTAFVSKSNVTQKEKLKDNKVSPSISKANESTFISPVDNTSVLSQKRNTEHPLPVIPVDMSSMALSNRKDCVHRKEINNQDLIDKTIEGIINRAVTVKIGPEDVKQNIEKLEKSHNAPPNTPVSLDEIESKMNELHGIPFVERPPHELPKVQIEHEKKTVVTPDVRTVTHGSKSSSASIFTNKPQQKNEPIVNQTAITKINEESDEEIIEHEPVTGDMELNKNNLPIQGPEKVKIDPQEPVITALNCDSKKEQIITENDFDKFARRNSITYENCLTVNFAGKEHHNVVQTVVEREAVRKKLSRNEIMLAESKAKSHKQLNVRNANLSSKIPATTKTTQDDDSYNKNYQSKVQIAYQSAMTAKRQQECPITIIEDKPVKVVFMDGNHEYIPHQLNVQGKELSPPKKAVAEWDHFTHSNSESLDSDIMDTANDTKSQDDIKFKTKHQRKQVLTPVEAPELELIEPGDLGIDMSPKKKRKTDDNKQEKPTKSLVPKKSYLLNRNIVTDDSPSNSLDSTKKLSKESVNQPDVFVKHSDPISAIDNLVKAAELLDTQFESKDTLPLTDKNSVAHQNSPVKRGRGRPRKYPLPESGLDNKSSSPAKIPTPQKKPRLIDAKILKHDTESEDDEVNSDGELVKENWTMGKINENIVCPICNKLFRSENVVFKHVKHCTGPSPSRSDSDKRSPRRIRQSQELDWKSEDSKSDSMDIDEEFEVNKPTKKKTNEKRQSIDDKSDDKPDVIIIEDTPIKDRDSPIRKRERFKHEPRKNIVKAIVQHGTSSLVCEICGKTFRQLSYLVNHRLQHKNMEPKKNEKDPVHKSLFTCEICKKDFRKLHHLVQHRIIHNPTPIRSMRKSSSEQTDSKITKDVVKATEDQSAGFRCEPCDKSFRKLHHLVEHRETHDEINKKWNPVISAIVDTTKPTTLHHCDICKKTFKKLQHLIEHKEHHLDTSSEKSDDKSVQSSLSTKDIIHECSLCYMVFPNEHSLNKHFIICQRKKKQSTAKQAKQIEEHDAADVDSETKIPETSEQSLANLQQEEDTDTSCMVIQEEMPVVSEKEDTKKMNVEKPSEQKKEAEVDNEVKPTAADLPVKPEIDKKTQINEKYSKSTNKTVGYERNAEKRSVKSKKHVPTSIEVEIIKTPITTTLKKKHFTKDKIGATVTKRQKTTNVPAVIDKVKTPDSSDDDEIRYMLNPNVQIEESNEGKLFMKVRAKKRNSLQIERPNSKDLMKRRISLQHPPKIPRLKVKPIARKTIHTNTVTKSPRNTVVPVESLASTDSDDSDVKYSFPKSVMKEIVKEAQEKVKRQKIIEKRKSLSNIAKRKSLGKMINVKQKLNPSPAKQNKKRTAEAEHRCDCGQLFSSAALLTRHTSLAHTPPRIRRRRSPPPDNDAKPNLKRTEKPQETRKSTNPAPTKTGVTTRKSSVNNEVKATLETRKTPKVASLGKTRWSTPHKGVPVPEKMRKIMEKSKK